MPFRYTYADVITQLRQLAHSNRQPAYVRADALKILSRELSPANPYHQENLRALKPAPSPDPTFPEAPLTPERRKDFHLHPVPADLADLAPNQDPPPDEDDSSEEEDDPF